MSSIDEIVAHLEREAARLRARAVRADPRKLPASRFPMLASGAAGMPWTPLVMQPPFGLRGDNAYFINEILALHGDEFIRATYLAVLGREPDGDGLAHHRAMMLAGLDKGVIVARVALSSEGRARANRIIGLTRYKVRAIVSLIPVVNTLVDWVRALVSLHKVARRLNTIEAHWTIQDQRIASHLNAQFAARQD